MIGIITSPFHTYMQKLTVVPHVLEKLMDPLSVFQCLPTILFLHFSRFLNTFVKYISLITTSPL